MDKIKLNIQYFAGLETALHDLSEAEMLNFSRNVQLPTFLGDELFPDRKSQNLKARFLSNANLLPKTAHVHAWDTKGHLMSRDGFDAFEFEKLLIKEQMRVKEELLIMLNQPRSNSEYNETLMQIFDDARNLMYAVKVRCERMKMELLADGTITIDENGIKQTIQDIVPADHKETLTSTAKWDDTVNSKPLEDIQEWYDKIVEDTGVYPTRALTSRKVLRLLQANESIQLAINGENNKSKTITPQALNQYMEMMGLPTIVVNESKYREEIVEGTQAKVVQKRFFPENKFVMFPEGNLGNGEYGATPTEVRRIKDSTDIAYGNIYVTVRDEEDPVVTITKAEAVFIPSFPAYNEVFQAQVFDIE